MKGVCRAPRQIGRLTGQMDKQKDGEADRKIDWLADKWTPRQTEKQ